MMNTKDETIKIEDLATQTYQAILNDDRKRVKRLFNKVERMYKRANNYTQLIMDNTFVFPISQLLEMNLSWGKEYLKMLPKHLKKEYYRQVYSLGI